LSFRRRSSSDSDSEGRKGSPKFRAIPEAAAQSKDAEVKTEYVHTAAAHFSLIETLISGIPILMKVVETAVLMKARGKLNQKRR
jgi:hypothetical protein